VIIWGMEWGEKIEALLDMQARGKRVPALENIPAYRPDLALYLRAYIDCGSDRTDRGIMRFSVVCKWAEVYRVDITECWDVLKAADSEVRKWQQSNSKR